MNFTKMRKLMSLATTASLAIGIFAVAPTAAAAPIPTSEAEAIATSDTTVSHHTQEINIEDILEAVIEMGGGELIIQDDELIFRSEDGAELVLPMSIFTSDDRRDQMARWCLQNIRDPFSCMIAATSATQSALAAQNLFPSAEWHNGRGDAFRHCYWNAVMTIYININDANRIATHYETLRSPNPPLELAMDLLNNEIGRNIGLQVRNSSIARTTCQNRANMGMLWTIVNGQLIGPAGTVSLPIDKYDH